MLILTLGLFIAAAMRPARANCVAEADRVLPGGDWGMISREGVKKYLCQGNPNLLALEKQRDTNRNAYAQQLIRNSKALAIANRASLLINTQRVTLDEWSAVFNACGNGRTALLQCVRTQGGAFLSIAQFDEASRLLLGELDVLLASGNADESAYYCKTLTPIRATLQAHLARLRDARQRLQGARSPT